MTRLLFILFIAGISFVIFIIKNMAGHVVGNKKLKKSTFKGETKKVMDKTAKGMSWMEQQWEQSKADAESEDKKPPENMKK
jgi:hypothetical protein